TFNRVAPGYGSVDNTYYGDMFSGTLVWVVKPTVVTQSTSGYTADWWGFRAQTGSIQANDYTPWYRGAQNSDVGGLMPDPPRLAPDPSAFATNTPGPGAAQIADVGGLFPAPPRLAPYPSQFASTDPVPLLGSNQATQLP